MPKIKINPRTFAVKLTENEMLDVEFALNNDGRSATTKLYHKFGDALEDAGVSLLELEDVLLDMKDDE